MTLEVYGELVEITDAGVTSSNTILESEIKELYEIIQKAPHLGNGYVRVVFEYYDNIKIIEEDKPVEGIDIVN